MFSKLKSSRCSFVKEETIFSINASFSAKSLNSSPSSSIPDTLPSTELETFLLASTNACLASLACKAEI